MMGKLCCPTCGHAVEEVPIKALADARFSRTQRKILAALAKSFPRDMSLRSLVEDVYAEDPSGGPDNASRVIFVLVSRLRRTLPDLGWTIPKNNTGSGNHGRYRLQKIEG